MVFGVLGYQALIFAIIYATKGNLLVTGAAVVWTLTHVFAPWLMILQFATIGIAYSMGKDRGK